MIFTSTRMLLSLITQTFNLSAPSHDYDFELLDTAYTKTVRGNLKGLDEQLGRVPKTELIQKN